MKINKSKFYHSLFSNFYFGFIGILIIFALLTTGIAIASKGVGKIMGLDWWIPVLIFDSIFIWSLVSLCLHYIIFKSPDLNIKKIKIISYFMLSFQNLYFLQRKVKMEKEDIVVPKFLTTISHLFPDDKIRLMFARIAIFIYVIFWLIGGLYVLKLLTHKDFSTIDYIVFGISLWIVIFYLSNRTILITPNKTLTNNKVLFYLLSIITFNFLMMIFLYRVNKNTKYSH